MFCLDETSLEANECDQKYRLGGYCQKSVNVGNGKGIITYFDSSKTRLIDYIASEKHQLMKFGYCNLDILNIYRSKNCRSNELIESLKLMLDPRKNTIITGDFNICFNENRSNKIIAYLIENGFHQLVHEPTHIRGRLIDHVYWLDKTGDYNIELERYTAYYSDHDGLCICISNITRGNIIH